MCPCACNYATDASCKCRDLRDSLTLTLAKSPVHATYGLTYVRSFNHWPVEKVQYTSSCADADTAKSPTCGWYDLDGQRVADSQVRALASRSRLSTHHCTPRHHAATRAPSPL